MKAMPLAIGILSLLLAAMNLPAAEKPGFTGEQVATLNRLERVTREGPAAPLFVMKYASVSMVELGVLGYRLPLENRDLPVDLPGRARLLAAPYMPRDGMNEHGLTVSTLNVPSTEPAMDPDRITIGRWQVNRLVLDHARTVEEAVQLLGKFNVSLGDTGTHYFIADALGHSAVVEYPRGAAMTVTRNTAPWQVATNFFVAGSGREGFGHDRFDHVGQVLKAGQGVLSADNAMKLLSEVSQSNTAWSVVYNLSSGRVQVAMARSYEAVFSPPSVCLRYLNQEAPRDRPQVFARGLVSTDHLEHSAPAFSPDGNEVFWSLWRRPDKGEPQVIMTVRREGGTWSTPAVAPFSGRFTDGGPVFSADGRRIYFYSTRPTPDGKTSDDIWFVEKQDKSWSEPRCLGFVARFPEMKAVYQPSITRSGTLYFISRQKDTPPGEFLIYRAELINGAYPKPELLPQSINAPDAFVNWTPFIAPDESYLLFSSGRRDRHGGGDLYIARRAPDGTWSQPEMLPDSINTPKQDRFPAISPDGQYLFFVSTTPGHSHDIYWVEARSIPALRPTTTPSQEKPK
jgi:hypothetical protein